MTKHLTLKYFTFKHSVIGFFLISLSACQLHDPFRSYEEKQVVTSISSLDFGQYYLKLKKLTADELLVEIQLQKQHLAQGSSDAKIKIILLSSLPTSPVYNAYTAKSALNEWHESKTLNTEPTAMQNSALMVLLKDQLNQRLFLFQKLLKQERESENAQLDYQQKTQALQLQITQLSQQIMQLKKIEKSINQHD